MLLRDEYKVQDVSLCCLSLCPFAEQLDRLYFRYKSPFHQFIMDALAVEKPFVLIGVTPLSGHMVPLHTIATGLVNLGYDVTFMCGDKRAEWLASSGTHRAPVPPFIDITDEEYLARMTPLREKLQYGIEQSLMEIQECLCGNIPSQYEAMQNALEALKERDPQRKIVLLNESCNYGGWAVLLDAPGLKPDAVIGIGVVPLYLSSKDKAAFRPGCLSDGSLEGDARDEAMNNATQVLMAPLLARANKEMTAIGGSDLPHSFLDTPILLPRCFLQMTLPELEYPRSDAPISVKFAGCLPQLQKKEWADPPSWWSQIVENPGKKKIVFVCQGTVALDYSELLIPTIQAMKDDSGVIVVAALGHKRATLPAHMVIPANTFVEGYVPFGEILKYADVYITNAGYGGFQQSAVAGVPLIAAGISLDKAEISALIAWSGCGINLMTHMPSVEVVRAAVTEILSNDKYTKRAQEIKEKASKWDPIGTVAREIDGAAASSTLLERGS